MTERATFHVSHTTRYEYPQAVLGCHQLAHLTPRAAPWQQLQEHRIAVTPEPRDRSEGEDYFGNRILRFAVDAPHDVLTVVAESLVEVRSQAAAWTDASIPWEVAATRPAIGQAGLDLDVERYRSFSPMVPYCEAALDYVRASFDPGEPWLPAMLALTKRIHADFVYDPAATTITTQVADVLKHRRGVCQDFAHLMICCLRSLGMAARYVSGYVLTRTVHDDTELTGGDASHAWIASHCPGIGWVAFDPTNGKLADLEFITLGWGRDFGDVTPLRGIVLGSNAEKLSVAVKVTAR